MQKLGLIFLAILIVTSSVSLAHAQEAVSSERAALVKQIAEVTGGKEQFNAMISASIESQRDVFKQTFNTLVKDAKHSTPGMNDPALAKLMDESMDRVSTRSQEFFTKQFDFDKFVEDVFVPVYAKHFTDDELRDLIALYGTPTGQKMVREMPKMMSDTMAAISKHLLPEFTEFMSHVIDDEMATIKKSLSTRSKP